jgi:hypothetical protein
MPLMSPLNSPLTRTNLKEDPVKNPHAASLEARYNNWLAKTSDPIASSILTLAETVEAAGSARTGLPVLHEPQSEAIAPEGMLDLKGAAAYLGYRPEGLRKLARQRLIMFAQNGRGPLRFRREWLDEFIASNVGGPKEIVRLATKPRRAAPQLEPKHGFDPALLSHRRAA